MAKGIFIIDAAGQISWTNWSTDNSNDAALKVVRGKIVTVTPTDQKALNGALEQALKTRASSDRSPLTVVINGSDGSQRHVIHVVPMHREAQRPAIDVALETKSAQLAAPADGAMVFVCDPSQGVVASPEVLQKHLGLSPSESRVASLISAGERPRTIAVKLGLTEDSARVILKRVFAKAGVSRQSELVALVSHLTSVSLR